MIRLPRNPGRKAIRPDWISKSLAGCIAGFGVAVGLVGLLAWFGPGGISAPDKVQVMMWLVPPLWLLIFSLSYLFSSGRQAWLWLGGTTLMVHALLGWTRLMGAH